MLYAEDSMGHHGGKGVREERDTVESWSRGAEPFLLVDRLKSAWAEYYAGPGQLTGHEKEGPRP